MQALKIIYFSSYDDSFSVFFYACASQSYDAFFFYHKAYSNKFLKLFLISLLTPFEGFYFFSSSILLFIADFNSAEFAS